MAQDRFDDDAEVPAAPRARGGGGRMVMAGVMAAGVLGAGAGLWARPALHDQGDERAVPASPAPLAEKPVGRLQVVIADAPTPIGQPLEVLPATSLVGPANRAPSAEAEPAAPVAPRRAPEGLMKVDTQVTSPPLVVLPLPVAAATPVAERPDAERPRVERAPEPRPRVEKAVKPPAKVGKAALKREAAKPEPVRAAKDKRRVAKAEPPKVEPKADHKVARRDVKQARAEKARRRELAEAKETAKAKVRLASLVRAMKATPAKIKREVAKAERRPERLKVADTKPAAKKAKPVKAAPVRPRQEHPLMRGEGPLRLANNTCVSADPGEALVCADPRLSVRERQMQRAYVNAEAAGVPAAQLRRQQQRWLAARAAAAREAPWAVEEVYEARIAELNDQSRAGERN